jgi:hypothetical protein
MNGFRFRLLLFRLVLRISRRSIHGKGEGFLGARVAQTMLSPRDDGDALPRANGPAIVCELHEKLSVENDDDLIAVGVGLQLVAGGFTGLQADGGALAARGGFENVKVVARLADVDRIHDSTDSDGRGRMVARARR